MRSFFELIYAPVRQYKRLDAISLNNAAAGEDVLSVEKDWQRHGMEVQDGYLVVTSLDGSMGANPRLWSQAYKGFVLASITLIALQTTYASAISSATTEGLAAEFDIPLETAQLSTAIFLFGFAFGALPVAPLSEMVGRQIVYLVTLIISSLFSIGTGASQTWGALLACRFFAGFFGAAVLAVAGGSLNDMYDHIERGYTFPIYAGAGFMGPLVAPIIGCTITQLWDWRWCYYLNGIIGCVLSVFLSISCPETLADIILFQKAHRIWKANRDTDFYGLKVRKPERKKTSPKQFARVVLLKAIEMLVFEPLIIYLTVLLSLAYFVLFGFLEAIPVIYGTYHGLELWKVGLCFIPLFVGSVLAIVLSIPFARHYSRKAKADGKMPAPEIRLIPLIVGGFVLPISLLWTGWAGGYKHVSIWASLPSGVGVGFSVVFIFISTYQMIIDTYQSSASSALAANVTVRYCVAGGAVLAARPLFLNLTPQWACTMLGLLSFALTPFSIIFYLKGERFRQLSRFAPHT